jgi:integrase
MLARHLAAAGLTAADADEFVFTDMDNGVIRYENWRRRIWIPAVTMAGCGGAGFHDLRRLAATILVVSGVDVKTAQVRLGHSDPRMTLAVYASAPVEADRDAAERLEGQFFGLRASEMMNNHAAREILRAKYAPNGRSRKSTVDPHPR